MRMTHLDVFRFISAMSVIFYHYFPPYTVERPNMVLYASQFGYLGVPFFFVISGYVIGLSANGSSPIRFAVSRFTRLYPTLWLSIFFTVAVTSIGGGIEYDVTQILVNMTLLHDYFGIKDIDGVYWTLREEIKFYGCIFILIVFGLFDKYKIWIGAWLFLTITYSTLDAPKSMGIFISPSYSPFFLTGVLLYIIHIKGLNTFNIFSFLLAVLLALYHGFHQTFDFISQATSKEAIVSTLLIAFFLLIFTTISIKKVKFRQNLYWTLLGSLTYPIYLIHNSSGKTIISQLSTYVPLWVAIFLTIQFMLIVALLFHFMFERKVTPIIRVRLFVLLDRIFPGSANLQRKKVQ